jgi:putative FmdB family regulatory protein
MPIYEFYCADCHILFNYFSKGINTEKRPLCPRCGKRELERQISAFATTGKGGEKEEGGGDDLPIDESRMERALESLAGEAESMGEDNPKQAADLMRKFSKMTGVEFGQGMREALDRMEAGEDPEKIEADMGDRIEGEEPFILPEGKAVAGGKGGKRAPMRRDPTLYDL